MEKKKRDMAYNKQKVQEVWKQKMEQRLGWLDNKDYIEVIMMVEWMEKIVC